MADQTADADAGDRPGVAVERASEGESRRRERRRAVTDGGVSEVEHAEVDPTELEAHPKNREIYGEDPDLDGLVTDMEVDGYDPGSPLTITDGETVVKGHRRWEAAVEAGIEAVPVIEREFESKEDEEAALLLDNLLQRDQSFSQKMREAAELERINDAENVDTGVRGEIVERFLESGEGRTRDRVAEAVGLGSGETYRRAKRVWEAAEEGDEEATEQVERIDEGEQSIHGAFTLLRDDDEGGDGDGTGGDGGGGSAARASGGGGGSGDGAATETETDADADTGGGGATGTPDDGSSVSASPSSAGEGTESESGASAGDVGEGDAGASESEGSADEPDVSDENPPPPAALDDRDDPSEEMRAGRGEGGGVGADAEKSPAEMDDDDPSPGSPGGGGATAERRDGESGETAADAGDAASGDAEGVGDDDRRVVGSEGFVVDGDLADRVRERAGDEGRSPEEMLDALITEGRLADGDAEGEGDEDADEGDESDGEGITVTLDRREDDLRSRARELDLEPDEVVNRLVEAWVDGEETIFG